MIKSRMVNNNKIIILVGPLLIKKSLYILHQKQIQHAPTDPYGTYLYMLYNIYVCNTHIQIVKNHK